MANIVINAAISKFFKDKSSGIASAIHGKSIVGLMDVRPVVYKEKTRHIAGLKYDKKERVFYLVSPKKADDVNIGIFVSSYDLELVSGKILAQEELRDVYEFPSVSAKFERGGYKNALEKEEGKFAEVFPKKINLKIVVATAKQKLVLKNSKGFIFTCDFKEGRWYVLRPGTTLPMVFSMKDYDSSVQTVFKHQLPFPALDRELFSKASNFEQDSFDLDKHVLENV